MNNLVIANTAIRRDSFGRYSLNDLHRAAVANGAVARTKEPAKFLSSTQTIELIREMETTQNLGSSPIERREGRYGGTFVAKEIVIAYAMWTSAKFHLAVIRAYDQIATATRLDLDVVCLTYREGRALASISGRRLVTWKRERVALIEYMAENSPQYLLPLLGGTPIPQLKAPTKSAGKKRRRSSKGRKAA